MEKIFYPNQKIYSKILLWIQRIFSIVFLYATLTLPKNLKLMDTPLVKTILKEYPTWYHVVYDILLTIIILTVIMFVFKSLVLYSKKHYLAQKYVAWIKKMDGKFIQNFLDFDFFVIKFLLATLLSVIIWQLSKFILVFFPFFNIPNYYDQPVVTIMVILGIIAFIESFGGWKNKIRRHLHITERF